MAAIGDRDFSGRGGWAFGDDDGRNLTRSSRVVQLFVALLTALLVWAYFARLDEVSSGDGRVVPTSREQVIQSLEGGILAALHVREDQVVEPGQILPSLIRPEVNPMSRRARPNIARRWQRLPAWKRK